MKKINKRYFKNLIIWLSIIIVATLLCYSCRERIIVEPKTLPHAKVGQYYEQELKGTPIKRGIYNIHIYSGFYGGGDLHADETFELIVE